MLSIHYLLTLFALSTFLAWQYSHMYSLLIMVASSTDISAKVKDKNYLNQHQNGTKTKLIKHKPQARRTPIQTKDTMSPIFTLVLCVKELILVEIK